MKALALGLVALAVAPALGGCMAAAAGAGLAAADYYADDNNVCDGPNDVGLIDSDCNDDE